MPVDIFMKIRNEFIDGPELRIYKDADVAAALLDPGIEPFAVNPNFFERYKNETHSLLKIRMEDKNLMRWLENVPTGVDPFSWDAVRALGFAESYMGVTLAEAKSLWSELNATVEILDEQGIVVGSSPVVTDTIIL